MTEIVIHKVKDKLPKYTFINIPTYSNRPKYTKFKNFLEDNTTNIEPWLTCDSIEALVLNNDSVCIEDSKCISCFLCLSSQRDLKNLESDINKILVKIIPNYSELSEIINKNDIFNGKLIELPIYTGKRKYHRFSDFTSINETKHISMWGCSVLAFLSSDSSPRIGKEIEIKKMDHPRDGRLDICILSNNKLLICESKVNLDSLLSENRYRIQIPSYMSECKKFIDDYNSKFNENISFRLPMLIGGEETDLLPPNHPLNSSITGNKSNRFYNNLIRHNIQFISADALWSMVLRSMIKKKRLCWDLLFDRIFDENTIGLLSAGRVIKKDNNDIEINKISSELLRSSEQVFS